MKPAAFLTLIARRDFDEAAAWYETQRDGLGTRFTAAVDETIAQAAEMPPASALARLQLGLEGLAMKRGNGAENFPARAYVLSFLAGKQKIQHPAVIV